MMGDMLGNSKANPDAEARICSVVTVKMWPIDNRVPLSTSGLIDVIKFVRNWRKTAPDRAETKPSVVLSQ